MALLHGEIRRVEERSPSLARDEAPWGIRTRTARRYRSGVRVRYAFATFVPELACDLVFGWREVTIP